MTLPRLLVVLVLVTHAVLAFDGASVLCFGADGHVGVESTTLEHQALGVMVSDLSGAAPAALASPDVHGPCVDVSLVPARDLDPTSKNPSAHLVAPPPAATATDAIVPVPSILKSSRPWDEPQASDSSRVCLRSTVLRI